MMVSSTAASKPRCALRHGHFLTLPHHASLDDVYARLDPVESAWLTTGVFDESLRSIEIQVGLGKLDLRFLERGFDRAQSPLGEPEIGVDVGGVEAGKTWPSLTAMPSSISTSRTFPLLWKIRSPAAAQSHNRMRSVRSVPRPPALPERWR